MHKDEALITSSASDCAATLQWRYEQNGYLYFPGYVDQAKCSSLLRQFVDCLSPHINLEALSGKPVLRGKPFSEADQLWDEVYPKLQSLWAFHSFFHDDDLMQLMRRFVGEEVFVYPMKMARVSTPGRLGLETPPHQDAYSHQAGPTMAGIWIALHDVDEGAGRLKLLPGSHQHGLREVFRSDGVGGVQCRIFPGEDEWHVSDVRQGDVIIFHSHCVHKAEPNTSMESVRISVDTRFCNYGAPVYVSNLEPHHGWRIEGLDWSNIYKAWEDRALAYYWAEYPNLTHEHVKI
ncbi:MAG: phytanoyl-CoA dioxygenase family protein [Gammaproteobacteria bacterium]|nr:phytanoyl-CoA dioxygenase family protein [Gammaproteobacteria bacterium]